MKFSFRSLLALLLVGGSTFACADSPTTARMSPQPSHPEFVRIRATDSLMRVTDVSYSDTSLVLKRISPLATDVSASAVIGPAGGEIKINAAGGKIEIPAGALEAPTLITMTAVAGPNVAYEFQPHGLVFAAPVKLQQDLKGTWASVLPSLLTDMHGSYYEQALDSAFFDPLKRFARVNENQIGYFESNKSQLKFYIGHFSGYMVSCGFADMDQ